MSILEDLKLQYKIGDIGFRLIFWNLLLFAVPEIIFSLIKFFNIDIDYLDFVSLSTNWSDLSWKPWSIFSNAFFHVGIIHLIFNMIMLHFTSKLFLTFFNQKQYLGLYFLTVLFTGICFVVSFYFLHQSATLVGASAAIMALLVATTTYNPLMEIRLSLIGHIKLWNITSIFVLIDIFSILFYILIYVIKIEFIVIFFESNKIQLDNTGGHIAHLSGAFFGFIYIKLLQNGTDLSRIVTSVIDFFANLFSPKKTTPFKKVHVNPKKPVAKPTGKIVTKDKTQQQIDEILDKISQSGYDSLTAEEKEFLFRAGK